MQYWILQYNPRLLPDNVPRPSTVPQNIDYWYISRYSDEVVKDDIVFIWRAGPRRGIYNVGTVISVEPHKSKKNKTQLRRLMSSDNSYWTDENERDRLQSLPTVLIEREYSNDFEPPILEEKLKHNGFSNLPIIRMHQRGIYRVEPTVGRRLLRYCKRHT